MDVGRDLAAVIGGFLVFASFWSVIGTIVVPRRVHSRITRYVATSVNAVFHAVADTIRSYETRDRVLAAQSPVNLVVLLGVWLAIFELGFGLLLWPLVGSAGLGGALEEAGSSLVTLGFVAPNTGGQAAIDALAAIMGLGTVALLIGYLPQLYAAFNRRETLVTLLDSRASVPSWGPELLARTHYGLGTGVSAVSELPELFEQWESWSADVSESHATYTSLIRFRSPRPLSSWITAQLAVLDAAALYLALLPNAPGAVSARLCLRGGFLCLNTIAKALRLPVPEEADPDDGIALTYAEFLDAVHRLGEVDFPLERPTEDAWLDFLGWRINYEAAAYALAFIVDAPPALWSGPRRNGSLPIAPIRPTLRRATKRESRPHEEA
jgi:hypothetical protein